MVDSKDPQLGSVDFFKPGASDLNTAQKVAQGQISKPLYPLTDLGNAQRLVAWYGGAIKYVPKWKCFLIKEDGYWHKDESGTRIVTKAMHVARAIGKEAALATTGGLKKELTRWALKSEKARAIQDMAVLAKSMPGILLDHSMVDSNPWLLQCPNALIDLRTLQEAKCDADPYITKCTGVQFDRKAKAPQWEKFLASSIPDPEIRNFLQRLAGYCITGDVSERILVMFWGYGRNGKSLFLRVLQNMLGEYATTTAPSLLMAKTADGHPTEVAHLHGARLAVTSEVKKNRAFDEEAVKRLTGNDLLTARGMRQDFWSFNPTFKLLVALNHKPRVRDSSDSIWDRIVLVPFTVRVSDAQVDRALLSKLNGELPGILAWAVEGCLAWQKDGLQVPGTVKAVTREYRREEDIVGRFFEDCCMFDGALKVASKDLVSAANAWTKANNFFNLNVKAIVERLLELGCSQKRTSTDRLWQGVGLKMTQAGVTKPSRVQPSDVGDQLIAHASGDEHPKNKAPN